MGLVGHNIIWWENRSFVREKWGGEGGLKSKTLKECKTCSAQKSGFRAMSQRKWHIFAMSWLRILSTLLVGLKYVFISICVLFLKKDFSDPFPFFCLLKMPLQNFPSLSHQGLACLGSFCRGGFSPNKTYQAIFWFSSILKTYQAWMLSHAWRRGAFISFFWSQLHRLLSSVSPIFPPDQAHTIYSSCACTA